MHKQENHIPCVAGFATSSSKHVLPPKLTSCTAVLPLLYGNDRPYTWRKCLTNRRRFRFLFFLNNGKIEIFFFIFPLIISFFLWGFSIVLLLRRGSISSFSHFLELYGADSVALMWFLILLSLLLKYSSRHDYTCKLCYFAPLYNVRKSHHLFFLFYYILFRIN